MSGEKKIVELNDEELEKVYGGGCGEYCGVTYSDGDVYVKNDEDPDNILISAYVLKNCGFRYCDVDRYCFNKITKEFIYLSEQYTGFSYSDLYAYYTKLNITYHN